MNTTEKFVNVINKQVDKGRDFGLQVGVMSSDTELLLAGLTIKKENIYILENLSVDLCKKTAIEGQVLTGGGGESPHTHPFSWTDKSEYIKKLKAGDKVLVCKIRKGKFVIIGKLLEL